MIAPEAFVSIFSPVLKRIVPIQPLMGFDFLVPLIRGDLLVTVAVMLSKYIELFVSKEIISLLEKTGTWFPIISLYSSIFIDEFPGVVIVSFPGNTEPGFVDAI